MEIACVPYERARHLPLLLLADPEEAAVDRYIGGSVLYECVLDGALAGVAAVLVGAEGEAELKNIAVLPEFGRVGVGSALLRHALAHTGARRFIVGTADASIAPLAFYQKNGFVPYGRIRDFFIDNYAAPVYEDGVQCRDMILLEWRGA